MKASGPQAQPACAGVRWAGIGAVAVRRDELDGTGAELTIPMTVPTSCRAYRADARSAGRDICGNQDLHVPVQQRARDMQVFLYIPQTDASKWTDASAGGWAFLPDASIVLTLYSITAAMTSLYG